MIVQLSLLHMTDTLIHGLSIILFRTTAVHFVSTYSISINFQTCQLSLFGHETHDFDPDIMNNCCLFHDLLIKCLKAH